MIPLDRQPFNGTTIVTLQTDPEQIYVDDDEDGPTIYVALPQDKRVAKWVNGASSDIQVGEECYGVSVDNEKNVYMTSHERHYVFKWSPQTNMTTIVAGEIDKAGSTDQLLNNPKGIHIDRKTGSMYVADWGNHRVQKWIKNANKSITVAGVRAGLQGGHPAALRVPHAVLVDDETQIIYVVDTNNHRIQRWLPNASKGDTIAGDSNQGIAAHRLSWPQDLALDKKGNLYVCDTGNDRVQMFVLIDNQPCPIISTTSIEMLSTTTTTTTPTPIKCRAVSSHWHQYNMTTMIVAIFSIVLWISVM